MAKPIKLKREETATSFVECECGEKQTSDLIRCIDCGIFRCDSCMPFGFGTRCLDCDIDDTAAMDEV